MRLAFLFREPLHRVMEWPASHIPLLAAYLAHEPAPDERAEYALAYLSSIYVNGHRKPESDPVAITDLMLFRDAWKVPEMQASDRYNEVDRSFLKALMK